jgi:hypothetical protein
MKTGVQEDKALLIVRVLKRDGVPLTKISPLPLYKGKGTKGIGL